MGSEPTLDEEQPVAKGDRRRQLRVKVGSTAGRGERPSRGRAMPNSSSACRHGESYLRNPVRQFRTVGSVRSEGGNTLAYSENL